MVISVAFRIQGLVGDRLSREARLVYLQLVYVYEPSVSRHLVARFQQYHVSHHYVAAGHFHYFPVSPYLYGLFLTQCGE